MRYFIFKDRRLVNTVTSRRAAIATIREMQAGETHYLLRAEFSIIHGDMAGIELKTAEPTQYYILENDDLAVGNLRSIEDAETMVSSCRQQPMGRQANHTIIHGTREEFIGYPKRSSQIKPA